MVQFYDKIPEFMRDWIPKQKIFWVATAPLSGEGHVNLSPKGGHGTFHIIDEHTVWYEDLTGSGVETISHIRENGRITILFNAFEGPPRIARLWGTGTVYEFDTSEYNALLQNNRTPGSRSVIMIKVHKTATSCGFAVPFFDYRAERTKHGEVSVKKEANDNGVPVSSPEKQAPDGLKAYWKEYCKSIDGLPAIQTAFKSARRFDEYTIPADFQSAATIAKPINLKAERSGPLTKTMLMTVLAFGAGVVLSAQVHNIIGQVRSLMP